MDQETEQLVSRLRWERRDRLTPAGLLQEAPAPRSLAEAQRDRNNLLPAKN